MIVIIDKQCLLVHARQTGGSLCGIESAVHFAFLFLSYSSHCLKGLSFSFVSSRCRFRFSSRRVMQGLVYQHRTQHSVRGNKYSVRTSVLQDVLALFFTSVYLCSELLLCLMVLFRSQVTQLRSVNAQHLRVMEGSRQAGREIVSGIYPFSYFYQIKM